MTERAPGSDTPRILVVDDEEGIRALLDRVLSTAGYVVVTAASVAEAVREIELSSPDVIVSDIAMPDEDGYALIRKVRALPPERGGRTPAVALSALSRAEDRVSSLEAGFQVHLAKPVAPAELVAAVASLAGRTPTR